MQSDFTAEFHDGIHPQTHPVKLFTDQRQLRIQSMTRSFTDRLWAFERMVILQKPQDDQRGIFGYPDHPDEQLVMFSKQAFQRIRGQMPFKQRHGLDWKIPVVVMATTALLLYAILYGVPYLSKQLKGHLPEQFVASIGKQTYDSLVKKEQFCTSAKGHQALEKMIRKLAPEREVTLTVVKDIHENALAIPGNFIVLHSALLENAESADEIAGIIAHELGHLHHQHGEERMINALGIGALVDAISGGAGTAVYAVAILSQLQYSREDEVQADDFAVKLMQQKGQDATAMTVFFERIEAKLDEEVKDKKAKRYFREVVNYVSTHPASKDRIERIRQMAEKASPPEVPKPLLTQSEWRAIQAICKTD